MERDGWSNDGLRYTSITGSAAPPVSDGSGQMDNATPDRVRDAEVLLAMARVRETFASLEEPVGQPLPVGATTDSFSEAELQDLSDDTRQTFKRHQKEQGHLVVRHGGEEPGSTYRSLMTSPHLPTKHLSLHELLCAPCCATIAEEGEWVQALLLDEATQGGAQLAREKALKARAVQAIAGRKESKETQVGCSPHNFVDA